MTSTSFVLTSPRCCAFGLHTRTTPELKGTVSWIAADQTEDKRTGASYYKVRIAVPRSEVARFMASRSFRECRSRPSSKPKAAPRSPICSSHSWTR